MIQPLCVDKTLFSDCQKMTLQNLIICILKLEKKPQNDYDYDLKITSLGLSCAKNALC